MPLSKKKAECKRVERAAARCVARVNMAGVLNEVKEALEDGLVSLADYERAKEAFLDTKRKQLLENAEIERAHLLKRLERQGRMHEALVKRKHEKEELTHAFNLAMGLPDLPESEKAVVLEEYVQLMGFAKRDTDNANR